MRDILVALLVFGSLPYIFKKPYFGAVMWVWISVMNLHSQGWGWARSFPFAAIISGVAVLALVTHKGPKKLPLTPVTGTFLAFMLWMCITAIAAIHPQAGYDQWVKVMKIFGMTLVVLMLMQEKKHINAVIGCTVFSLAYYGVKGGIFTIRSGGSDRVWGPAGTFIEGNNEIALALIMIIPLMIYCISLVQNKWAKRGIALSAALCALSALGSYSRGAAIALAAMCLFLWLKSANKGKTGLAILVLAPAMLMFMPSKWFERVDTVKTYEEDASAMGRINAWKMATNLALDRPLGGGFEVYTPDVFAMYAPEPKDIHAAHSIYFQALGEHGFGGLGLYLLLGFFTWRTGSWNIRHAKPYPDLKWAVHLSTMSQVGLLGFAVGGAFLSLVYFDVPYYIMCALVATQQVVKKELAAKVAAEKAAKAAAAKAEALGADLILPPDGVPVEPEPVRVPKRAHS